MAYDKNILLNAPGGENLLKKVENGEMTLDDAIKQAARNVGKAKVDSETGAKLIADAINERRNAKDKKSENASDNILVDAMNRIRGK